MITASVERTMLTASSLEILRCVATSSRVIMMLPPNQGPMYRRQMSSARPPCASTYATVRSRSLAIVGSLRSAASQSSNDSDV